MTTFKHAHYSELAENKTYKKLLIEAPRGEIRDRYGRLLAGNKNSFTVQISGNDLNKNGAEKANEISLKLIELLEKNNEEYVDEFPIYVENGKYFYTFDRNINEYKKENNIPLDYNAKKSFYFLVDKAIKDGVLTNEDKDLDPVKLQQKLNENGYYPPILVKTWTFTDHRDKKDWLESYKIKDRIPSAREAFLEIRNSESLEIDKNLSDEDARKILVVRDLVKSQGYVGKMPATQKEEYEEKGYSDKDMVGLAGIEKSYEDQLKGKDGYKMVQVDALGRISQEIESKEPESGDTVYLSIDKDLQEIAESSLKQVVEVTTKGGTFKSKFGNKSISTYAGKAKSGALIAIDVKTGEVLASASYPDYDPNKFATGISSKDYKELQPQNQNDLLAASPLLNLSGTMVEVITDSQTCTKQYKNLVIFTSIL